MIDVRLFDILTRHQVYLEAVKYQQGRDFNEVLRRLDSELRRLLGELRFDSLDALTKSALNTLIAELRQTQWQVYNEFTASLIAFLKAFMTIDVRFMKETLQLKTDKTPEEAAQDNSYNGLYGLAAIDGSQKGDDRLWSILSNSPIPANGYLTIPFIAAFASSATNNVENLIRKGYANGWTIKQALDAISGTKAANYRDGALATINRQADAIISTITQHVSAGAQSGVASIYFKRYRWVSILDGKTTDICIDRAGHIFRYADGPQPPAHVNCRSKTVPIVGTAFDDIEPPKTFAAWLETQPETIRVDLRGVDGKPRVFGLTLSQFESKFVRMLATA
jgi:SPP1 gp7 family putative phage head morphogenesis protein